MGFWDTQTIRFLNPNWKSVSRNWCFTPRPSWKNTNIHSNIFCDIYVHRLWTDTYPRIPSRHPSLRRLLPLPSQPLWRGRGPFRPLLRIRHCGGVLDQVVCLKLWVFMLTPEIANICNYAMFQDMAIQRIPSILMDFREIYFRDLPPKSCHAQCHKSTNPKTRLLRHLRLGGDFPTSTAVVEQNDAACFEKNAQ